MKDLKVVSLKANGVDFNPLTYKTSDSLEAIVVSNNNIATVRCLDITNNTDDAGYTLHSSRNKASEDFMLELDSLEDGDYDVRNYLINGFQEYLYPFIKDDEIVSDKTILVDWVKNNLECDDEITIVISSFERVEQEIVIKRNDIGVSVDYYDGIHDEPIKEETFLFEDFKSDIRVLFPTSCGVTANFVPNVVLIDKNDTPYSLWYHTSFYKIDDALEYLKDVFRDGILEDDIGLDSKGALWLTFEEMRKGN